MREPREFDDIPGTFVFDGQRNHQGYHLNMFCKSLDIKENREVFRQSPAAYLNRFPMTGEQREAVLQRRFNRLLELGGNIYYTWKIAAFDRVSMQAAGAAMSDEGMTEQEFRDMMLAGGRPMKGNRSKSDKNR
ncbi:protocatechuate 4,5-dioxygenase subunit alpha [Pseudomaricurvus alkylphenolicus]|nr:protocatechuate 4,5-dioxygenase subunit alpha [Pseudomaricurvus alkylphenolicus]